MKFNKIKMLSLMLVVTTAFSSCSKYQADLPGTGDIPDNTPPEAMFSYTASDENYLDIQFTNESISSTDYSWDLGNGTTSSSKDPMATYAGPGTYMVSLIASDKLGAESTYSMEISLVEPPAPTAKLPEILEAGFEDNSLSDGSGDGRDSWKNDDLGGVIQITSSPVNGGSQAAKFPSAGDRIAYQELSISPNTDYVLTYYYTMKTSGTGSLNVDVLAGGGHSDLSTALAASIANHVGSDQTDSNLYVKVDIPFNTGDFGTVSILVTNSGVECRADDFSLEIAEES